MLKWYALLKQYIARKKRQKYEKFLDKIIDEFPNNRDFQLRYGLIMPDEKRFESFDEVPWPKEQEGGWKLAQELARSILQDIGDNKEFSEQVTLFRNNLKNCDRVKLILIILDSTPNNPKEQRFRDYVSHNLNYYIISLCDWVLDLLRFSEKEKEQQNKLKKLLE